MNGAPLPSSMAMAKNACERAARGKQLLAEGDVTAARSFFRAAAEAGDAEAALAMGGTYDPNFWEHGARGMKPDIAAAKFWYRRALDLGSKDTLDRIDQLGKR